MHPVTDPSMSGMGNTPSFLVEGTWVVGFFRDAEENQQPIIMGTLPGVPTSLPTKGGGKGFQDRLNGNYPKYTETDVNRLAVNDADNPHPSLTIRKADRETSIGRADFNSTELQLANSIALTLPADDGTSFDEPETTYKAQYPYNHVYETEGGHIKEFDDTPDSERIHERHSKGTGYEINEFGDKVQRVKRDNYEIISNDHFAHIKGTHNTTVDGGVRVFVNANATADSNYTIQVGSNANVNIQVDKGNVNLIATQGEINMKAEDMNIDITKDFRVKAQSVNFEVNGSLKEVVTGSNTKTGNPINLN